MKNALLLLALSLASCKTLSSPSDCLRASQIQPAVAEIAARHDAYVAADLAASGISEVQSVIYLQQTALLTRLIEEAMEVPTLPLPEVPPPTPAN